MREKDRKLIAAAPDLLEVAKLAYKLSNMIHFPDEGELNDLEEMSKKAIEKAVN